MVSSPAAAANGDRRSQGPLPSRYPARRTSRQRARRLVSILLPEHVRTTAHTPQPALSASNSSTFPNASGRAAMVWFEVGLHAETD